MEINKPNPVVKISGLDISIEKFFISELGHLMMRTYNIESESYRTYNLGTYNPEKNIFKQIIEEKNEKK